MTTADFLNKLERVSRSGDGWTARCPGPGHEHGDRHASLTVSNAGDKILMHCHVGCSNESIVAALGLKMSDLFNEPKTNGSKRIVATYDYVDESGALLYQVVRFEPKDFRARRPNGDNGWIWNIKSVRRVLYRLPELLAADPAAPVFVTAGEKDCDNLRALGLVATTNSFGEGKNKWREEYNNCLRDRMVVLPPDNDATGRDRVEEAAISLHAVTRSIRILTLLNLPEHGDISDWLEVGGTAEELKRLAAEAPEWKAHAKQVLIADSRTDPLEQLRKLPEGASFAEIEEVLRGVGASLNDVDGLRRQVVREEVIKLLKALKVSSPARLIDAVLPHEQTGADSDNFKVITECIGFKVLDDGRIIEQIGVGFAVYDPEIDTVQYSSRFEHDGVTYQPFGSGDALKMATRAVEYTDDASLDRDIKAYIHRYLDISPRDLKLAASYVKLSHIVDHLMETPYLRPIGSSGKGKSRYVHTVGGICYRAQIVTNPSAASLYRLIDQFHCTLAVDECNFHQQSDDLCELIRILNSGYQKGNPISRVEKEGEEFVVKNYDPFSAKIIASLEATDSLAFESRCLPAEMVETTRNDIQFRMSKKMLAEQAELRGKLLLWRFRNCRRDFESKLAYAELELRKYQIRPRHVQIATPLFMLLTDPKVKKEFATTLEDRKKTDAVTQLESIDGQIAQAVHELMFTVMKDEENITVVELNGKPEQGKAYDAVPVSLITEALNKDLPEKRRYDQAWVGKKLRKLGLQTNKCNDRSSEYRDKKCLVYDLTSLKRLFASLSLPVSEEFTVATVASTVNIEPAEDNPATARPGSENAIADLADNQQRAYAAGDGGDSKKPPPVITQWAGIGLKPLEWPLLREGHYDMEGQSVG
ncbi:MAG TPA: hypothetical protein VLM38_09335 [Blastocatellia bacterium]|nr:hypothetical protein [Blastocatellia bacterium]